MPALRGAPRSWVRFGRDLFAGTRVSALSPSDLFGDVVWDQLANARSEPDVGEKLGGRTSVALTQSPAAQALTERS